MFGLGKKQTTVKKILEKHNKNQQWLCIAADINKDTATKLCSDENYYPSPKVERRVLKALQLLEQDLTKDYLWTR